MASAAADAAPASIRSSGAPCGYCSPPEASASTGRAVAEAFSARCTWASAEGGGAAGFAPWAADSAAGVAPGLASPMVAMTAPMGALSPSLTAILLSLPEA